MSERDRLVQRDIQNESQGSGSASRKILPGAGAHVNNQQGSKWKKYKWYIIGAVVVCLVALIIGLVVGLKKKPDPSPGPGPSPTPTPSGYNPYEVSDKSLDIESQFVRGNLLFNQKTFEMLNAMPPKDSPGKLEVDVRNIPQGQNNKLISNVSFEFGQVGYQTAMATFTDATNTRWSIPERFATKQKTDMTMRLDMSGFELLKNPFGFKFTDTRDRSNTLLTTEGQTFIMYDKYMQMDIILPSRRVFGLGERSREFGLTEGTWTMWANGQETPYDGGDAGKQTYGVHPFVLIQTKKAGQYMGMYFRNSNAQSPIIQNYLDNQFKFSYITTGGQIEVYFFIQGTAKQIISMYQQMVGLAQLPPFWSLGWHAAAYAYSDQSLLEENINGYKDQKFPLEGVWIDIDYMDGYKDFSVNKTAFPTIKDLTINLQKNGQKMILIVDAGLSSDDVTNKYYADAIENNLLMKSAINAGQENGVLTQHVWPNKTVFLDFFDDNSKDVWGEGLNDLHDLIPYDGIWLDMNEATGFCNGECPDGKSNYSSVPTKQQVIKEKLINMFKAPNELKNMTWYHQYTDMSVNSTYFLPFIPGKWNLDNMSLSLNATHPSDPTLTQYDTHSLFGHTEGKMTYEIFTDAQRTPAALKDKRVFLLSRSTFAGSGKYLNHWLGDNHRTWLDMKTSIAGIMNMQMFGIPLVGPDTCGFFGEADQNELCARWVQLSTFYPFARQHRDKFGGGGKNEIWRMPEPYHTWAKNALYDRLQWVRHVYTCMFRMHTEGYTCYDPLFFHFPTLDEVFNNVEHTFIVGDALKVSPVLAAGVQTIQSFFPNGRWVSMKDYSVVEVNDPSGGKYVELQAPSDTVNVHLMPGKIAIYQDNTKQDKMLTDDMLKVQSVSLIVNRDSNKHADGRVFLDDGISLSSIQNGQYLYYEFQHNDKSLIKQIINDNQGTYFNGFAIGELVITDAADLKGVDTACYITNDGQVMPLTASFSDAKKVLTITGGINFQKVERVHYLQKNVDFNLCDPTTDFYTIASLPDLSKSSVSMTLTSTTKAARDLQMDLTLLETGVLNMKWNFAKAEQGVKTPFQVPADIIDVDRTAAKSGKLSDLVTVTKDPLTITVKDMQGQDMYKLNGMQLGELFNHIDASFYTSGPTKGLMGLFEQVSDNLFLKDGIYSLWSRDQPDPMQTGTLPSSNMYGTHPLLMSQGKIANTKSAWNIVFHNLAAAQDWRIKQVPLQGEFRVKTYAAGGMGDIFFMSGKTAGDAVGLLHTVVGKPVLVPQWTLGWNQCRWGYSDLDTVKEVVQNYSDYNLPLDVQWSDIDYLDRYRDFTFDPVKFNGLGDFVKELHGKGMKYVPIIDAGISKRPGQGYSAYDDGVNQDVFIKTEKGDIFTGRVWPGDAAYPDFMNDKTIAWWKNQLTNFQNQVNFDGLWLDMNEASNFCNGACYLNEQSQSPVINKLPYLPSGRSLETKSIALDAVHIGGVTELDVHSMFGAYETKATHGWFKDNKRRTMIIERSAFAGTGKFASRWMGDNFASQEYMGASVTGAMAHNIIGIPLVGSDICGFIGDTTPELCARWYTLGAFYPFSRNHNNWGQIPQEPWVFTQVYEGTVSYFDIIKNAMYSKLHLIRYYYTELTMLSRDGGVFIKPLFFEFNDDGSQTASQEQNVMLGSALKLSINSNKLNQNTTTFYFPEGWWCNLLQALNDKTCGYYKGEMALSTKAYEKYVHLRQGYIVPMQEGSSLAINEKVRTTKDLQNHPVDFHLTPDCITTSNCIAVGRYLNDDGEVLDQTNNVNIWQLAYHHTNTTATEVPTTLTLQLTMPAKATNFNNNVVNKNDLLGSLYVYNAAALNLNKNSWNVKVYLDDQTVVTLNNAMTYDATRDRLSFPSSAHDEVALPKVTKIEITTNS